MWATDEFGFEARVDVDVRLPTAKGWTRVPQIGSADVFKSLGVMRCIDREAQRWVNASGLAQKTISKADLLINDRFPVCAQVNAINRSITGSMRFAALKTEIPWTSIMESLTSAIEVAEAKLVLGLPRGTPSAYLLTECEYGGCGIVASDIWVMVQAVAGFIGQCNAKDDYTRRLARYAIELSRMINGVSRAEGSMFLDWECSTLSLKDIDSLKATPFIAITMRFCLLFCASVIKCKQSDRVLVDISWKGMRYMTADTDVIRQVVHDLHFTRLRRELVECKLDCAAHEAESTELATGCCKQVEARSKCR